MPILITAFIIKVFRIGKSKLESFKETLGKINPGLRSIFSRILSDIKDFSNNENKILKKITELNRILNHPYIRNLLNSIEKDIKTLNNIISYLLKETENKKLTQHMLVAYSSKFNMIYNNAIYKTKQLSRIINTFFSNPALLRRFGNTIFITNNFTPQYLVKLKYVPNDLNKKLETVYSEGQKIFRELNGLLTSTENIVNKLKNEIYEILNTLKRILNNIPLPPNYKNKMQRKIKKIEGKFNTIIKSNMSPFQIEEELIEIRKQTNNLYKSLQKYMRYIRRGKFRISYKDINKLKRGLSQLKKNK
jgi:hypothetical protein